jgi:hypothetical protein
LFFGKGFERHGSLFTEHYELLLNNGTV